jgi:enoyl-CoA hydratase/carnithine racemase
MNEILSKRNEGVLTLTLNRPAKMNAINTAMYAELVSQLRSAASDSEVRTVLFVAEGPHFTAGNDIYDFLENPPEGMEADGFQFILELHNFPKPLIAVVQGSAVGIGTTMLLHCDVVLATPSAVFSMPFVTLGLVPEAGSSYLLPQLMGYQRAAEILFTGRSFDAQEAHEFGLVGTIAEDALEQGIAVAERIASQPPTAVTNTKALLKSSAHHAVTEVIKAEGALFRMALHSDEAREALMKFATRRGMK